ncbi:MAG: hypothetical protein JSV11_09510 [Nitrospiraceae bacterium]|nr:MAG: hypothetical protein JSV11_09510 [Nitrospiraceae bacterium]
MFYKSHYRRWERQRSNVRFERGFKWVILCVLLSMLITACGSSGGLPLLITTDTPEGVGIVASDGMTTITWSSVTGATSYNVYWSNTPDVSPAAYVGKLVEDTSPYDHTNLTNGVTYYYVVTAVSPYGESAASLMVGATPKAPPPSAPQFVSAQPTPDTTNSITIAWPDVLGAASYNIYWDTVPGVTKDAGTRIQFVQAPYEHTGLPGRTTYYYVVTAVDAQPQPAESDESAEVSATARGPINPVGGHDEGFGNNLSVPVIFANGHGVTGLVLSGTPPPHLDHNTGLRPTAADITRLDDLNEPFPYFDPAETVSIGGAVYYPQGTTSTWQADWADGSGAVQNVIAHWGDNLVSAPLRTTQMIRVETVLTQVNANNMEGFAMTSLYGSMRSEVFGTDGITGHVYTERMVFAPNARLKIELLDAQGNPVVTTFDKAIYESFGVEGPGGYASEINGKGSLVYGYNWKATAAGSWRLTFSLDTPADHPDCAIALTVCDNTVIDNATNGTRIDDHTIEIEVMVQ